MKAEGVSHKYAIELPGIPELQPQKFLIIGLTAKATLDMTM
jgi:hypothetical protein